jgi:hypothetical protein
VHHRHSEAGWRRLHHYFFAFHDEMVEAIATDARGRLVRGTMRSLLADLTRELTERPVARTT